LLHETRGSAATEYITLLGVVALVTAAATVTLGPVLLEFFSQATVLLVLPT
jgi:Flp pilus assembly pilin Flp